MGYAAAASAEEAVWRLTRQSLKAPSSRCVLQLPSWRLYERGVGLWLAAERRGTGAIPTFTRVPATGTPLAAAHFVRTVQDSSDGVITSCLGFASLCLQCLSSPSQRAAPQGVRLTLLLRCGRARPRHAAATANHELAEGDHSDAQAEEP